MKKSIRIAATMCAAVFMAGVFAGCNFDWTDKDKDGDGSGGSVENRFAGKTIEYENTDRELYGEYWYEEYDHYFIVFNTSTTGTYLSEYRYTTSYHTDIEESKQEFPFTYSLELVNGKNILHMVIKNITYHLSSEGDGKEKEYTFDEYVEKYYVGISSNTKKLLRERESTVFWYYEFTDNDTVKLYRHYYTGDMAKSSSSFHYNSTSPDEYVRVSFGETRLRFRYEKQDANGNRVDLEYWGIPQFNGKSFTAEMYLVDELRNEAGSWIGDRYTSVGKITGTYGISDMGSKCSGTLYFTSFPNNEMKNLFTNSYQIQNYDPDDDDNDPDYTEYTIIKN